MKITPQSLHLIAEHVHQPSSKVQQLIDLYLSEKSIGKRYILGSDF